MSITPRQILNILVKKGIINQERSDQLELESINKNIPIGDFLLAQEDIDKGEILLALSSLLKVPYVDLSTIAIDPQAVGFVPETIARRYTIFPVSYKATTETIIIATHNPLDLSVINFLEKKTGKRISFVLSDKEDINRTITSAYARGISPEVKAALKEVDKKLTTPTLETDETTIKEAPIAKIVNTILEFAIKSRSSDIHIEPEEAGLKVRYRIDGILYEKLSLPVGIHDALISRIKILSQMKIDEKRIPQDGRFNYKIGGDEMDLRVSTLPTVHGEKIVMRLLKKTGGLPTLNTLGLQGVELKVVEEVISKPYGIILVTGPTGSGKTTTLYSILSILNKPSVNIVTIEDPVEYEIQGINQVQINVQAGLTFANGLKSFLRQDPNIILVGEIRDKETTQLAIQAALTGHLVFSTLHTNDAATAIPRLIDLGGEPFLIASVLNATIAQRIVRKVCQYCKKTYDPPQEIQNNIKTTLNDLLPTPYKNGEPIRLVKGEGCDECVNSGYLGRIGIFEVIKISPMINKMILKQQTAKEIENQAKSEGMITMKQDGYLKVLQGITTIEEIMRVAES